MSDHGPLSGLSFDVGVAVVPLVDDAASGPRQGGSAIPGYDETSGRGRLFSAQRQFLVERGEESVRAATEAVATQIGIAADRIAATIGDNFGSSPAARSMAVESIEVSFGVTLAAGVQALFTAQAESSVQVTVTLRPRHQDAGSRTS
jgi:hypothetical protein